MKTTITALSLLLLASTSQAALAQDRDRSEARHRAMGDREPSGRMGRAPREASRPTPTRDFTRSTPPPEAPRAREAPAAPAAPSADGGRRRAEGGGRGGAWIGRGVPNSRSVIDTDGDEINDGLTGADRQDREDRDELRQRDRWVQSQGQNPGRGRPPGAEGGQRRGDGNRGDGDRAGPRGEGDRNGDRRGEGDRNGDRRGDSGRNGDRRWDGDRDGRRGDSNGRWDNNRRGPPPNHPRWDGRRYPRSYSSNHRYRGHYWTPPLGFYVHVWNFGEYLPRGWYEPSYRILDWWNYGLPVPPPGYTWVRVGDDALMIDEYNGRVVQVVRYVFW